MDTYAAAVAEIIKEQQSVIGPLALDQAKKVSGLYFADFDHVTISGNRKDVLAELVKQYSQIFGQASVEVCREALKRLKSPPSRDQLPEILR